MRSRIHPAQKGPTSLAQEACEAQSCYPVDSCGAPVTDDDRPRQKRSWREIDKMRDRGGPTRRDQRDRDSFERSTGYTKYKTNLERLFSGGAPLPEHLREKSGPDADPAADDERKKLVAIEDTKVFHAAAKEFLARHALPDDPRLLDRLLGHPDKGIMEQA